MTTGHCQALDDQRKQIARGFFFSENIFIKFGLQLVCVDHAQQPVEECGGVF